MKLHILLFAKEIYRKMSYYDFFLLSSDKMHISSIIEKVNGVHQVAYENNSADIRALNKHQFEIVGSCIRMKDKRMKYGREYLTQHIRMRYRSKKK